MARRVNRQALVQRLAVLVLQREGEAHALRTADPVLLHQPHFFRPLGEAVQRGEQFIGVSRDLQEPLGKLALFDQRT